MSKGICLKMPNILVLVYQPPNDSFQGPARQVVEVDAVAHLDAQEQVLWKEAKKTNIFLVKKCFVALLAKAGALWGHNAFLANAGYTHHASIIRFRNVEPDPKIERSLTLSSSRPRSLLYLTLHFHPFVLQIERKSLCCGKGAGLKSQT